ncbi:MAG: amidohydrolase family protein, partial [Chloroflexota bacterium]|nr:amidohydrolase family protein [Chloroflexota bacterium]
MKNDRILIQDAAFVVTMDSQRRIIRDGSILLEGQRISAVGKSDEISKINVDRVINGQDMVVTPGFVNGHCHISYAHATRGVFPDDLGSEYLANVFRLQSSMSAEEEHWTSLLAITELLSYGTTTIMDPGSTKHVGACMGAYEQSGVRIITGTQITDRVNPYRMPIYTSSEALNATENFINQFNEALEGRVTAWVMPFSAEYVSGGLLTDLKRLADHFNTGVTLHVNNTERVGFKDDTKPPLVALQDQNFSGRNVVLAHCVGINKEEIAALAATGTCVVTCPTNVVKNGGGYGKNFPLADLLEAGVTVGLGTDAGNNSNVLETNRSMYLAAVLAKDGSGDVSKVPAETALELATIEGAKALGLDSEIGSIEVGKKADLVLYDTMRPEWQTLFNPVNSLVYNADGRSVHTVVVDGRVVVDNYRPTFVDTEELIRKVQRIGKDMMSRNGVIFAP